MRNSEFYELLRSIDQVRQIHKNPNRKKLEKGLKEAEGVVFYSLEEVKNYLYRKDWTVWDYITLPFYRLNGYWRTLLWYCKRFYQRGKYGWSKADTWDWDSFLLEMIPQVMEYKIKNNIRADKKYLQDLHDIRNTFVDLQNWYPDKIRTKDELKRAQAEINYGFKLIAKRFMQLWD